jgi:PTH1 family peptidyl-tRNA hydrolase
LGALRLVVGLGNPGDDYARTRHNIGFRVVEHLAGDADWKDYKSPPARFARRGTLFLAEPLTYMNDSGMFVQAFCQFYKIAPQEMLVCYDDIALPFGQLRLRPSGSAGGHNGMKSLIAHLGTDAFPRLRFGVGPQPAGVDSAHWVLKRFSSAEEKALPELVEQSGAAVLTAVEDGLETAMNRYNRAAP